MDHRGGQPLSLSRGPWSCPPQFWSTFVLLRPSDGVQVGFQPSSPHTAPGQPLAHFPGLRCRPKRKICLAEAAEPLGSSTPLSTTQKVVPWPVTPGVTGRGRQASPTPGLCCIALRQGSRVLAGSQPQVASHLTRVLVCPGQTCRSVMCGPSSWRRENRWAPSPRLIGAPGDVPSVPWPGSVVVRTLPQDMERHVHGQVIAGTQKVQGMCIEITWKPDALTQSLWPCRFHRHLVGRRRDQLHLRHLIGGQVDLAGVAGGCALGWENGLLCLVEVTEWLRGLVQASCWQVAARVQAPLRGPSSLRPVPRGVLEN